MELKELIHNVMLLEQKSNRSAADDKRLDFYQEKIDNWSHGEYGCNFGRSDSYGEDTIKECDCEE